MLVLLSVAQNAKSASSYIRSFLTEVYAVDVLPLSSSNGVFIWSK